MQEYFVADFKKWQLCASLTCKCGRVDVDADAADACAASTTVPEARRLLRICMALSQAIFEEPGDKDKDIGKDKEEEDRKIAPVKGFLHSCESQLFRALESHGERARERALAVTSLRQLGRSRFRSEDWARSFVHAASLFDPSTREFVAWKDAFPPHVTIGVSNMQRFIPLPLVSAGAESGAESGAGAGAGAGWFADSRNRLAIHYPHDVAHVALMRREIEAVTAQNPHQFFLLIPPAPVAGAGWHLVFEDTDATCQNEVLKMCAGAGAGADADIDAFHDHVQDLARLLLKEVNAMVRVGILPSAIAWQRVGACRPVHPRAHADVCYDAHHYDAPRPEGNVLLKRAALFWTTMSNTLRDCLVSLRLKSERTDGKNRSLDGAADLVRRLSEDEKIMAEFATPEQQISLFCNILMSRSSVETQFFPARYAPHPFRSKQAAQTAHLISKITIQHRGGGIQPAEDLQRAIQTSLLRLDLRSLLRICQRLTGRPLLSDLPHITLSLIWNELGPGLWGRASTVDLDLKSKSKSEDQVNVKLFMSDLKPRNTASALETASATETANAILAELGDLAGEPLSENAVWMARANFEHMLGARTVAASDQRTVEADFWQELSRLSSTEMARFGQAVTGSIRADGVDGFCVRVWWDRWGWESHTFFCLPAALTLNVYVPTPTLTSNGISGLFRGLRGACASLVPPWTPNQARSGGGGASLVPP